MELFEHNALDLEQLLADEKSTALIKKNEPIVLAVAGGSGVGKSLLASLLSMELAKRGHETVLIDADFNGAGLYEKWQHPEVEKKILNYLQGSGQKPDKLVSTTTCRHLRVLVGAPAISSQQRICLSLKIRLYQNIRHMQARYIVVDLGAGAIFRHLDFFLMADYPLLVANSDKASLLEAFQILRTSLARKTQKASLQWPDLYQKFLKCGELNKRSTLTTVAGFLKQSNRKDRRFVEYFQNQYKQFHPALILNKVRTQDKRDKAGLLPVITKNVLSVELQRWGNIRYDEHVSTAAFDELGKGNLPAYLDMAEMVKKQLAV
jgi:flagellar biosynthesis protein FlhG